MLVVVTGASGYIGGAVARALTAAGHEVIAPVRSETAAAKAAAAGASPVVGDLTDREWLTTQLADADAAIHTASPGDASSPGFDADVADTVIAALTGTGKHYVHTSGVWIFGDGTAIDEDTELDPPALTSWRPAIERKLLDSDATVSIVAPGIVYGNGAGITSAVMQSTDDSGRLLMIGDGSQHWTTVHVDDLGELYRVVVERDEPAGYVLGVGGQNPTVREIAEAAAGDADVVAESVDASRARLGEAFADALLLDQQADGGKARSLGWAPTRPGIVDELRSTR